MKQNKPKNLSLFFTSLFLVFSIVHLAPSLSAQKLDISNQPLSANSPLSGTRQLSLNQETKLIQMEASILLAFKKFTSAIEKESIKAYQPLIQAISLLKANREGQINENSKKEFVALLSKVQENLHQLEEALRAYEIYKNLNPNLYNSLSLSHKDWTQVLVLRQEALKAQKLYINTDKLVYLNEKKAKTKKAKILARKASKRLDGSLTAIKTKAATLKKRLKRRTGYRETPLP